MVFPIAISGKIYSREIVAMRASTASNFKLTHYPGLPSLSYSRIIRDDQNQLWAVGVYRKRDRKIIHSLCLIFTTFVLISLSVHRPCAGRGCLLVNEGISWLTYRASECASAHSYGSARL